MNLNFWQTILILVFMIFIDDKIRKKIIFFRRSFVPSLFIGGLIISIINFLFSDIITINLDQSTSTFLVTLFFSSIGLRYTKQSFSDGLNKQILFLILAIFIAIFQNIFLIILGYIFPIINENFMLHGSMTLMGDLSLSTKLMGREYIEKLIGIETFTIIAGTIACSFTFKLLSKKRDKLETIFYQIKIKSKKILIIHVIVLFTTSILSFFICKISIFKFLHINGIAYITSLLIRWNFDKYNIYEIDNGYVNRLGNYFLSMFIILKFSSLDIGALKYLDLQNIVIILFQVILIILCAYHIVYKLYKEDTLAVYVSTALVGYSIGIPPSTMSVLQHIGKEKGTLHHIVLIVPVVGAWLIALINPFILKIFFK